MKRLSQSAMNHSTGHGTTLSQQKNCCKRWSGKKVSSFTQRKKKTNTDMKMKLKTYIYVGLNGLNNVILSSSF